MQERLTDSVARSTFLIDSTADEQHRELSNLVFEFRLRARHFGRLAYICEALIAVCIFGGIYVFWYSDLILQQVRQRAYDQVVAEISSESKTIRDEEQFVKTNRAELAVVEKVVDNDRQRQQSESIQEARRRQREKETRPIDSPLPGTPAAELAKKVDRNLQRISDLTASISRSESRISLAVNNIAQLEARKIELRKQPEEQVALAIATKIGSVLLLLFFVRVLVSIFRYYSRLSAYFQARADAFTFHKYVPSMTLESFSSLVFPTSVEFEKTPDGPDPPGMAVTKEILAARGKPQ